MNYVNTELSSSTDALEVHCEACGVILLRFPVGRFMRASDQTPRMSIIVCAECGTKNAWDGVG